MSVLVKETVPGGENLVGEIAGLEEFQCHLGVVEDAHGDLKIYEKSVWKEGSLPLRRLGTLGILIFQA